MLEIVPFVLGPVDTNAYLVGDSQSGQAVAIDPAWDGRLIAAQATQQGWRLEQVWVTHAHFDHMAGTAELLKAIQPPPGVALHPADLPLWRMQGGAPLFGMRITPAPEPSVTLEEGQLLSVGNYSFEVRCTPGHTPGHVLFHCVAEKVVFCGDLIFAGSVGRTDLPGGSFAALLDSIQHRVLSLPDETRLFSGHGPVTTVGEERINNPFLS